MFGMDGSFRLHELGLELESPRRVMAPQGIAEVAVAASTFWHKLAREFDRLAPAGGLCLEWQYTSGNPGKFRYWLAGDLIDQEGFRVRFERLARKAGGALDEAGNKDSLEVWFAELREHDNDPRNQSDLLGPEKLTSGNVWHQRGRVPNVCKRSAVRCYELEAEAFEAEQRKRRLTDRKLPEVSAVTGAKSPEDSCVSPVVDRSVENKGGQVFDAASLPQSSVAEISAQGPGAAGERLESETQAKTFVGDFSGALSERDSKIHEIVGQENFCTLTNSDIMHDKRLSARLRTEFKLRPSRDATKAVLDRIRRAKGYPLSRKISKERSTRR